MNNRNIVLILLIVLAIATRLMPHYPNFTALGAAAIFGGAMFKNSFKAFLIPITVLFLSDIILNNVYYSNYKSSHEFQWFTNDFGYMYIGFTLSVLIGRLNIKQIKILPILSSALLSALVFFLLTNFGSWLSNPMYSKDIGGLLLSYEAGIPFALNDLGSTALYSMILFGAAYSLSFTGLKLIPERAS
tara:strand:+ start:2014 stop:2577 length:564 start_codon:yes stop_codon:yes gene_type:complete